MQPPKQRPMEACTEGPPQHLPQQRLWTLQQRCCVCPISSKSPGALVHCRPAGLLPAASLGAISEKGCAGICGPLHACVGSIGQFSRCLRPEENIVRASHCRESRRLQAQDRERRRQEQQQARAQAERELASERQKLEEAALPLMLDAMWAANVMDIQQTLKAVCHEVHACCAMLLHQCHLSLSLGGELILEKDFLTPSSTLKGNAVCPLKLLSQSAGAAQSHSQQGGAQAACTGPA